MDFGKIEPRLSRELARLLAAGEPNRRLPVLIEHAEKATVPEGGDLTDLQGRVGPAQEALVERLRNLGVRGPVDRLVLANAVSAMLTPVQVEKVAAFKEVALVRLAGPEQVTT